MSSARPTISSSVFQTVPRRAYTAYSVWPIAKRGKSNAHKRPEDALAAYEQALRLDPNSAFAYLGKGVALHDLKRPEEALAAYEQALRLDPNNAIAYYNKGVALGELKRNEEALAAYEQALR